MKSNVWLRLVSSVYWCLHVNNNWSAARRRPMGTWLMSSLLPTAAIFFFLDFILRLGRTTNCSGTWRITAVLTFCACLPIAYGSLTSCFLISKSLGRALVVHLHDVHQRVVWLIYLDSAIYRHYGYPFMDTG